MMLCPSCSFENRADARFCEHCGQSFAGICPRCSTSNSPDARFCRRCGAQLATQLPLAFPDSLTVLQQSAPTSLQLKVRDAVTHSDGERKPVTILFTDIVGSTSLAERLDPEDWKEIVSGAQRCVSEAVYRYEGTVAQLLGDGVLAFFGAPITHEDDPIRAVRAALDIQSAIADYARSLAGRVDSFEMRVGIHTGRVVVGSVGSDLHIEYLAIGDAVNVAARLQTSAAPGTILISNETYSQARGAFEVETLTPLQLKGKSEPVLAHRVLGLKTKPIYERSMESHVVNATIVGRSAEFSMLENCVRRLLQGEGGILSIVGDAGVGKSRLISELRSSSTVTGAIRDSGLRWLEGSALSFGRTISYWPFREILECYAGIAGEDTEARRWQKLENSVAMLFPTDTAEILPYLSNLLALGAHGDYAERIKYLDGEAMGRQLFLAARRFFERLAQTGPVVLVFEDLHWADESSFLLLEHLLALTERTPLLICWLSRPDSSRPAARLRDQAAREHAGRLTEIELGPLGESDSALLIRNLLPIKDLPPRIYNQIIQKAEGNPFFLEEIIHSLIDSRAVVRDPTTGQWQATAQFETLTLPDTVQGVIMARIDRLEEEVRQVLKMASVIGRSFLYRLLTAIAAADRELDEHLAELQAVEFIGEKQRLPELEFMFKHALAQEAAYESILLYKRRELHAQVAQAIEDLFPERLEEFYSLLAYHYARAEKWDKAQEYLFRAGDQAGRVAADTEALAHYEQALAAYVRVFGERWDPVQRAGLERKMGEAFYRRGEQRVSVEYFERALRYLGYDYPTSSMAVRLAILKELAVQAIHRLFAGRFVVPFQDNVRRADDEAILIFRALAWIALLSNADYYVLWALRTLNFAEQAGRGPEVAAYSASCGLVGYIVGLGRMSGWYLRRAVSLAERLNSSFALGNAYSALACVESWQGQLGAACEHCEQGVTSYRKAGDLYGSGLLGAFRALLLCHKGDLKAALQVSEDIVQVGEEAGDAALLCWGQFGQGAAQVRLGQVDKAMTHLRKSIELSEKVPDHTFFVGATAELARCYALQADMPQAYSLLQASQARRKLRNVNLPNPISHLLNTQALICVSNAERVGGSINAGSFRQAQWACQEALKHSKIDRLAAPEAMRLSGTLQWLRGNRDAALKLWERSIALCEVTGTRYDLGMVHLEIGKRLDQRENLDKAEAIMTQIGAERERAQAQSELARISH